jgi:hypothetical protein
MPPQSCQIAYLPHFHQAVVPAVAPSFFVESPLESEMARSSLFGVLAVKCLHWNF